MKMRKQIHFWHILQSKVENENQIKVFRKKIRYFKIRSVYGYSTDTMRINIMPNLFSQNCIAKWK